MRLFYTVHKVKTVLKLSPSLPSSTTKYKEMYFVLLLVLPCYQDNFPVVNEADIKVMDRKIAELQETIKKTSENYRKMESSKYVCTLYA